MQHDYYRVLGVDPNASFETIRDAYRQRAMKCHPDRDGSHEQMVLVNEAWEILSNPELRQRYDEARAEPANLSVQKAAAADAQQAHQQAEQYPRHWADFEVWLDSVAKDFNEAEFKPVLSGFSFLRFFPSAGKSLSGKLFVLLGGALGVITFTYIFFGVLRFTTEKHYYRLGLHPPGSYFNRLTKENSERHIYIPIPLVRFSQCQLQQVDG